MDVRISSALLGTVLAEAARMPEQEVCGLLLGSRSPFALSLSKGRSSSCDESQKRAGLRQAQPEREEEAVEISELVATPNVAAEPSRAFEIDPAALFAAIRAERAGGPSILGHYHSHPNGSTTPSARDSAMADKPGRLWLIVAGDAVEAWREIPGGAVHSAFEPVRLVKR